MAIDVQMPKLSDNMETGTIVRWLKHEGDAVAVGEALAEVETDKADVELEATDAGILREIRVAEGQSAAVGDVIAVLTSDTEAARVTAHESASPSHGMAETGSDARTSELNAPVVAAAVQSPPVSAKVPTGVAPPAVRASPLAWRIAVEGGLDLSQVRGSGPGGRILKRDVEALLAQRQRKATTLAGDGAAAITAPAPLPRRLAAKAEAEKKIAGGEGADANTGASANRGRLQELSRMRLTIAQRMAEANREIPHFYVTTEVDMSEAWRLRQALKESGAIPTLTVTHVIVKAVALALTEHPLANASWRDGSVEFYDDANIGIAVAVEDGLIVPVLHRAQQLSLRDVSVRIQSLTDKARSGRFAGQDLTGATFSVSNLGILDVEQFTAVITPPQSAVLAIGTVKERPVVRNGALAVSRTMYMTLSCDHRVLNGLEGGEFLTEVKRLLEAPYVLLMGGG